MAYADRVHDPSAGAAQEAAQDTAPEAAPGVARGAAEGHAEPGSLSPANMADVARLAGVSIATVSRALRDVPGVGESTRRRVREVADQLSYVVSPEASSLSRRETGRVAVVMPRMDVWFYSMLLGGLERGLRAEGMDVLVYQVPGPAERGGFVLYLRGVR